MDDNHPGHLAKQHTEELATPWAVPTQLEWHSTHDGTALEGHGHIRRMRGIPLHIEEAMKSVNPVIYTVRKDRKGYWQADRLGTMHNTHIGRGNTVETAVQGCEDNWEVMSRAIANYWNNQPLKPHWLPTPDNSTARQEILNWQQTKRACTLPG